MPRGNYKGLIDFEEGYSETFEQFKDRFETCWVFREMESKKRLAELKIAFEIATKGNKTPEAAKK